jgi:hypothetical protein
MPLISLYIADIVSNPSFAKNLFPTSLLFLLSAEFMKQRNVLDLCDLQCASSNNCQESLLQKELSAPQGS